MLASRKDGCDMPVRYEGNRDFLRPNGTNDRAACGVAACYLSRLARSVSAKSIRPGRVATLHTQHFPDSFPSDIRRESARSGHARRNGAVHPPVDRLHQPRGIIGRTLSDDFDTPTIYDHLSFQKPLTIFLVPPVSEPALQTFDSWERLVIGARAHPTSFISIARVVSGRRCRPVFGRVPGLFPNQYQPSWVIEGLATYYESAVTRAAELRELSIAAVAADAAAGHARFAHGMRSISRAGRRPGARTPTAAGSGIPVADRFRLVTRCRRASRSDRRPTHFRSVWGRPARHVGVPDASLSSGVEPSRRPAGPSRDEQPPDRGSLAQRAAGARFPRRRNWPTLQRRPRRAALRRGRRSRLQRCCAHIAPRAGELRLARRYAHHRLSSITRAAGGCAAICGAGYHAARGSG